MTRPDDTLEQDLDRMFHRREADVTPPLRIPAPVRRSVRRRQGARVALTGLTAAFVVVVTLAAVRALDPTSGGVPGGGGPTDFPTYAPPSSSPAAQAPFTRVGQGTVGGIYYVLLGSGDPVGGVVRTRVVLTSETSPRGLQKDQSGRLDHLDDPVRAVDGVEVIAPSGAPRWVLWGFWTLGVDRISVALQGCRALTITNDHLADVDPSGSAMGVWHVATACGAPVRVHASTVLGTDLGTRAVGHLPVRRF